jgi:hypothetical protein
MADQGPQGQSRSDNPHAEHGDMRVEELKQKYGDVAEAIRRGRLRGGGGR